jgi:hypothetical protein
MKVFISCYKPDNSEVFYKVLELSYLTDNAIGKALEEGFFKGGRYYGIKIVNKRR